MAQRVAPRCAQARPAWPPAWMHEATLPPMEPRERPQAATGPVPSPWPPRPPELAGWPPEWRRRWGERANELEAGGVPWPQHEQQAFEETKAEMTTTPATWSTS